MGMPEEYYLNIGKASDLKSLKDRILFRFFEMLPGILSWSSLILAVVFSWRQPFWVAIFIILFSFFWLFRTIYFSILLWFGYRKMEEYEKIDWVEKLNQLPIANYQIQTTKNWQDIYQLVVIPMCKESLEVVRDSFNALVNTDYPKDRMIIVLACEERVKDLVDERVEKIKEEFGQKFFKFLVTWHPEKLPGEIAGKGANETWGAKLAKEKIIDYLKIPYENIIFSSFDVDTCLSPKYFSCLTFHYLTTEKPTRTSFQPIPLFVNNIWQTPVFSQIISFASTFWHTMNQERPEKLVTFSSHSMSFKALTEVGFKQTNVVSDDSRIFWQCFLRFNGDYETKPLYYPLSMDANVAKTFWRTLVNVYKQQRRWAYGVGDIPYFLFGFTKNKKIPLSKKISLGLELMEGHLSWAVGSILIFLLGWLPIFLGGHVFTHSMMAYNLPKIVSRIMTIAMVGIIVSCYFSLILLPPKPRIYGRAKYVVFTLSWILCPLIMIFFISFPALDAQTRWLLGRYMGFWATEKVRK